MLGGNDHSGRGGAGDHSMRGGSRRGSGAVAEAISMVNSESDFEQACCQLFFTFVFK